ncbi:MAG: ATP-binding protein [Solirubrobacterales bacterium]
MTEKPRKNPFRPGVGTRPLHLAGRDQPMRRFGATLRAAPEQPANMRLTGLRGVGKTVLLGEFQTIAENDGWASAMLELQPGHNAEDTLVTALASVAQEAKERISRVERIKKAVGGAARHAGTLGIGWGEFTLTYDPIVGQPREDITRALFEAVETTVEKGRSGFVLLLDEAQVVRDETKRNGEHPLSLLISSVVALQRREIPLGLVLCGLPTLTGNLLKARSYTERMFRGEEIGSLGREDARDAFAQPLAEGGRDLEAEDDLIDRVIGEVEGYPYFIQLWGAELWDAAEIGDVDRLTTDLLETVRPDIYRRLDLDFYNPRVETLTPAEQDVLLGTAFADYPPLVVSKLNDAINKTPANVNVLLGRLVDNGVLYRLRKGEYDYTAPRFRDYLLRRTRAQVSGQSDKASTLF